MEHAVIPPTIEHAPMQFLRSPLGIAVLVWASSFAGAWLKDRLSTETRDTSSAIRIEALDTRVTTVQSQLADYQHNVVTAAQFAEFREANDKRLDDIHSDLRELLTEVNSDQRQSLRSAERRSEGAVNGR